MSVPVSHDADLKEINAKDRNLRNLHALLSKHVLRREKSVIKDQLPKKSDYVVFTGGVCPRQ
jgi:SNF2 family DNA or RNA helicase